MKTALRSLPLLLLATALVAGCTLNPITNVLSGAGTPETRSFDLSGFTELEAQSAFDVTVTQGDDYAVEVTVDTEDWERIDVRVEGKRLVLGMKDPRLFSQTSLNLRTLQATVTMPELDRLELSGAANARISGFASGDPFEADLSGASNLSGDLEAGDMWLDLAGASRVTLEGSGGNLQALASGASALELADFTVLDAALALSGASRANVNVAGQLDVDASGASNVVYTGSPELGNIDTSGASSVNSR